MQFVVRVTRTETTIKGKLLVKHGQTEHLIWEAEAEFAANELTLLSIEKDFIAVQVCVHEFQNILGDEPFLLYTTGSPLAALLNFYLPDI